MINSWNLMGSSPSWHPRCRVKFPFSDVAVRCYVVRITELTVTAVSFETVSFHLWLEFIMWIYQFHQLLISYSRLIIIANRTIQILLIMWIKNFILLTSYWMGKEDALLLQTVLFQLSLQSVIRSHKLSERKYARLISDHYCSNSEKKKECFCFVTSRLVILISSTAETVFMLCCVKWHAKTLQILMNRKAYMITNGKNRYCK